MKIVFIGVYYANNSSTVVYGGDILSFHIFEALNDNFEAYYFHSLLFGMSKCTHLCIDIIHYSFKYLFKHACTETIKLCCYEHNVNVK